MKIKLMLKRILILALVISSIVTATITSIPIAKADSSGLLGTNAALGSPVLNNNFVIDDWNKWEFVCWGVYLSNFCVPLLDDYNSAFKEGAGGTDGRGYQALCFGSGSDQNNNKVIEALCDEAIINQMSSAKEIYVRYGSFFDNDVTDSSTLRVAKFQDLFFQLPGDGATDEEVSDKTYGATDWMAERLNLLGLSLKGPVGCWVNTENYTDVYFPSYTNIPTFYIKRSDGEYVKVFDYRNAWDLQIIGAILNAIPSEFSKDFQKAFETYWESNPTLKLDSFANITVEGKMIIPSSCNQYITKKESINLLNSFVFNSYVNTTADSDLILGLRQITTNPATWGEWDANRLSGNPAINETNIGNVGLLFYDTDSIVMQDYILLNMDAVYEGKEVKIDYGDVLDKLFNCNISNNLGNYPLKFEIASGTTKSLSFNDFSNDKYADILNNTRVMAGSLANIVSSDDDQTTNFIQEIILPDGSGTKPIFGSEPVVIANQYLMVDTKKEPTNAGAMRTYYNFLYEMYHVDDLGIENKNDSSLKLNVKGLLESVDTQDDLLEISKDYWSVFQSHYSKYKSIEIPEDNTWVVTDTLAAIHDAFKGTDTVDDEAILEATSRAILAYPVSPVMKRVSEVMGLEDGREFNLYCSYIYMTYLDWYGIGKVLNTGDSSYSEFNPDLFEKGSSVLGVNINKVIPNGQTQEDKEKEALELGLLLLKPEEGREYRKNLVYNGIEDFLFEQYNRIVYGGADSMYTGTASKSNSGFLAIETYESNPLTAPILDNYVDIIIWVISGLVLAIIVIGVLKKKGISWGILNIILAVNVLLIIPSSGEIVPYMTSRFIQNMFDSKMTYWSISEGVTNSRIESDTVSSSVETDGLSQQDAEIVLKIVNSLNSLNTDRSLMIKQDISQKVTQKLDGIYSDIQKIQSARWLLPVVMEQFSGEDNTAEYLYVKLSSLWTDMSNFYWYYQPADAEFVTTETATSGQTDTSMCTDIMSIQNIMSYDARESYNQTDYNYRNVLYDYSDESSNFDNHYYPHQIAYMIESSDYKLPSRQDVNVFGVGSTAYENADSWQKYIDYSKLYVTNYYLWHTDTETNKNGLELIADQYSRYSRKTIEPNMSYLKHTETPAYYFYNVVKDAWNGLDENGMSRNYNAFVTELQGNIKTNSKGEQVRNSFMHATIGNPLDVEKLQYTGYVRDILDLQELFNHTIPYLYEVQLLTGGFDGKSGVLGDATIQDNDYYEGQLQSWFYRCNWATKIMENPEFSKPTTVRDSDGNKYNVANPLLWECYPATRPMVFSEAQMHAYGLREADLNIVELKCIEVNKKACDKWTLLINYVNTPEMTKEIMFKQMATDATMIFNEEFSTSGVLNNIYKMYPTSIDLRYLSFDSVMKMIMLNVSKNTSYVYGTTMQTLIADSDLFTALLLLLAAVICAWIIPLARVILMALIFYLGFLAIIRSIFSSSRNKAGIACGQFITNILFMVYTLVYYGCFALIMAITSNDEVLSINHIHSDMGNPVWALLAIIAFSSLYVYVMGKQIVFCLKNYRDMGKEVYAMMAHSVTDRITDGLASISNSLYNWASGYSDGGTGNIGSIKGTGSMNRNAQDVNIRSADNSTLTIENSNEADSKREDITQQSYSTGESVEYRETTTSDDINAQIEVGKHLD